MKEKPNFGLSSRVVQVSPIQVLAPGWQHLVLFEKLERHRAAADRLEGEAAACSDPRARRHLLNNAEQHRCCMMDLQELHGAAAQRLMQ